MVEYRTKGKWLSSKPFNFSGTLVCYITSEDGKNVAQTRGCSTGDEKEVEANGKLLASAPEMYDALKEALIELEEKYEKDGDMLLRSRLDQVRNILNKVEN